MLSVSIGGSSYKSTRTVSLVFQIETASKSIIDFSSSELTLGREGDWNDHYEFDLDILLNVAVSRHRGFLCGAERAQADMGTYGLYKSLADQPIAGTDPDSLGYKPSICRLCRVLR